MSGASRIVDMRHDIVIKHLHEQQRSHHWIGDRARTEVEGVLLRKSRGNYLTCPSDLKDSHLAMAIDHMDCQVSWSLVVF